MEDSQIKGRGFDKCKVSAVHGDKYDMQLGMPLKQTLAWEVDFRQQTLYTRQAKRNNSIAQVKIGQQNSRHTTQYTVYITNPCV